MTSEETNATFRRNLETMWQMAGAAWSRAGWDVPDLDEDYWKARLFQSPTKAGAVIREGEWAWVR